MAVGASIAKGVRNCSAIDKIRRANSRGRNPAGKKVGGPQRAGCEPRSTIQAMGYGWGQLGEPYRPFDWKRTGPAETTPLPLPASLAEIALNCRP